MFLLFKNVFYLILNVMQSWFYLVCVMMNPVLLLQLQSADANISNEKLW